MTLAALKPPRLLFPSNTIGLSDLNSFVTMLKVSNEIGIMNSNDNAVVKDNKNLKNDFNLLLKEDCGLFTGIKVIVSGAKVEDCNGIYSFWKILNNVSCFMKFMQSGAQMVIYRSQIYDETKWYIATLAKGLTMDNAFNIHHYSTQPTLCQPSKDREEISFISLFNEFMPSKCNWWDILLNTKDPDLIINIITNGDTFSPFLYPLFDDVKLKTKLCTYCNKSIHELSYNM